MVEQLISQFEVGLHRLLYKCLRVILINGAYLREVRVDKLSPVELIGLQWALLVSQTCASH